MIKVYKQPNCPQCTATMRELERLGVQYEDVDLSQDEQAMELARSMGYRAAPVVIVTQDEHWCGFRPDLIKALKKESQ